MYEAHFGLHRRPFVETVDPSTHVPTPSRDAVVRRLRYALEHAQGPALVFGPPGSGKSLIARVLARQLGTTTAYLTFPALPTSELLDYLAEELGAGGPASLPDGSVIGPLRRLRQRLAAASARGERPLVVVDVAHLIDAPATFEILQSLLNFATLGPPDLMLLLVGGAEVLLSLPEGLADRLAARCLLGAFTESETATYLHGRLNAAGATRPLFSPESIKTLHRAAEGLPRRLNRLADLALLIAYAEGRPSPDARAIAAATQDVDPDGMAA
ncbi:MAG: ExeA family protein [Isosphaeraceae bacterium]